jgi:amino acid transporter
MMRAWAIASVVPMLLAVLGFAFYRLRKQEPPRWTLSLALTSFILVVTGMLAEPVSSCQNEAPCLMEWGDYPLQLAMAAIVVAACVLIYKAWNFQGKKEVMQNAGASAQDTDSTDDPASRRPRTERRVQHGALDSKRKRPTEGAKKKGG